MALCKCGCGGDTKSRFVPGHDSKLKSRLFVAAKRGDGDAYVQIQTLGWGHLYDPTQPKPIKEPRTPRTIRRAVIADSTPQRRIDTLNKSLRVARRLKELRDRGVDVGPILNMAQVDDCSLTDEGLVSTFGGGRPPFWGSRRVACAGLPTEWWFPKDGSANYAAARRICNQCHHKIECGQWALEHPEEGMWGGLTPKDRIAMRKAANT